MKKILPAMGAFFCRIGRALIRAGKYLHSHPLKEYFVITTAIFIVVEILTRRSFIEPFTAVFKSPVVFLFNYTIVGITTSVAMAMKHRYFFYALDLSFWLTISITDFVLRFMRTNPFSAIDLDVVKTGFKVIPKYIGWGGIILVIAAFAAAGFALVILWKKCPVAKDFKRAPGIIQIAVTSFVLSLFIVTTSLSGYIPKRFETATTAYGDYGFSYCFFRSFIQRGVISPDEYSEEAVNHLMEKLGEESPGKTADESPNIIYLQLESFFDVNNVIGLELSENPIPVFTELKKNCPTGQFSVNAVGGGTANTEFEVLCGMDLSHFGLLECPYSTILYKKTCESAATVLRDAGFSTHAIHNHEGTFYSRYQVYPNLGFDTFTPIEYMINVETNELDWAKDAVLTEEIMTALTSTEGRDFVFAVSVQPHGKYPNYETVPEDGVQVLRCHDNNLVYEVEYYVNQLRDVDTFIGELLLTLKEFDEDVVVVMYGDHLPTLGIEDDDMFDGNMYTTEYVVWSNCGFESDGGDINAFELSAKILGELDISGGNLFRVQRELGDDPRCDEYMQLLEYDMLSDEGKNYSFGGKPLSPVKTVYGLKDITVSNVEVYEDVMFVYGKNFTKSSSIFINGKKRDTVRVSDTLLLATDISANDGAEVYVAQLSDRSTLLSRTDSVKYEKDDSDDTGIDGDTDSGQDVFDALLPGLTATDTSVTETTPPETEISTDSSDSTDSTVTEGEGDHPAS